MHADDIRLETETVEQGRSDVVLTVWCVLQLRYRFVMSGLALGVYTVSAMHPVWKMGQVQHLVLRQNQPLYFACEIYQRVGRLSM